MLKRPPETQQAELQRYHQVLRKAQAFPYAETLRSVMVSPVFTCGPADTLEQVLGEMARKEVSSVVVVDAGQRPLGIITERDVMRRVLARGVKPQESTAQEVMTPEPVLLSPEDSIYRALSVLSAKGIKHLPLTDEQGRVVGIVTLRQLLKLRHPEPMMLISRIQEAGAAQELAQVRAELPALVASKLTQGIGATDVVAMLSLVNHDVHRKALELAIQEVGEPPGPFCLFVTGSHGRMENLLSPDQDHGMVLADEVAQELRYFMALGKVFSGNLEAAGFDFCPGYIMSMNPGWRKGLGEWKAQLRYWYERQGPAVHRYLTLMYDARGIWGEMELFAELHDYAHRLLGEHHELLRVLWEEEEGHRVPLGLWGRFITERKGPSRGYLDIKRSGLLFVVEAVRLLALLKGVRETSTAGRLKALREAGHLHPDDAQYYQGAYEILLYFALRAQAQRALEGLRPQALLRPSALSGPERQMLRQALRAVAALQKAVAGEFGRLVI